MGRVHQIAKMAQLPCPARVGAPQSQNCRTSPPSARAHPSGRWWLRSLRASRMLPPRPQNCPGMGSAARKMGGQGEGTVEVGGAHPSSASPTAISSTVRRSQLSLHAARFCLAAVRVATVCQSTIACSAATASSIVSCGRRFRRRFRRLAGSGSGSGSDALLRPRRPRRLFGPCSAAAPAAPSSSAAPAAAAIPLPSSSPGSPSAPPFFRLRRPRRPPPSSASGSAPAPGSAAALDLRSLPGMSLVGLGERALRRLSLPPGAGACPAAATSPPPASPPPVAGTFRINRQRGAEKALAPPPARTGRA